MKASSLIFEAWVSISANRLRTVLAMLGIVIGVSSVVLMMAIGDGSSKAIEKSIKSLGTNLVIITPGNAKSTFTGTNFTKLKVQDIERIRAIPTVADVSAQTEYRSFVVSTKAAQVVGVTEGYFRVHNWKLSDGRTLSHDEINMGARYVVIGQTVVNEVFEGRSAIGRLVTINDITYRVIGTLQPKGKDMKGVDQDNAVFMPISTAQRKLWGNDYWSGMINSISVQVVSQEAIPEAIEGIREVMREKMKLKPTQEDRFNISDLASVNRVASETTRALSILLGAIASISLIVGGIGIMNIMLVTVSERTREIGIRKAIGASEGLIMMQFLLEAIFIAVVGSIIGLLVGFGLGLIAEINMGVKTYYAPTTIILSLVVACGVGILSGFYPAQKAARLEPIEALRTV